MFSVQRCKQYLHFENQCNLYAFLMIHLLFFRDLTEQKPPKIDDLVKVFINI